MISEITTTFRIKTVLILEKILKNKTKSYSDEPTDFHNKEMFKAVFNHTCLTVITIDSAFKKMITITCKCS